ncbi:MAG TPA: YebC/PmpR family DNA-binding transcriptional regulator [Elusimicrobiota bacterium]|nr:YebC/PmpR family DNA-binding transcriptional regulator [Elusimicrobiota bacterium]
MGGHSHWAGIKHKKAITDAKKGKVWTKIVREITMAARMGGGDPGANPRLRRAVDDARASNMPSDNIKRAIQKGTGELEGAAYEELVYEGYGPGGTAILVQVTTDNRNRTGNEIALIFTQNGGNKGEVGCVGWMFKAQGLIAVAKSAAPDEDAVMSRALDLGAEDFSAEDKENYEIYTDPKDLDKVKDGLAAAGLTAASAEIVMNPSTRVPLGEADAQKVLALIDALEENDDVMKVHANFDIPDEVLSKLG